MYAQSQVLHGEAFLLLYWKLLTVWSAEIKRLPKVRRDAKLGKRWLRVGLVPGLCAGVGVKGEGLQGSGFGDTFSES